MHIPVYLYFRYLGNYGLANTRVLLETSRTPQHELSSLYGHAKTRTLGRRPLYSLAYLYKYIPSLAYRDAAV